jgi:hypothetical protein
MGRKKPCRLAPSATPWDNIDESQLTPTQALVKESHKSAYRFRHESFDKDIEFFNSFERERCPLCGSEDMRMFGHEKSGMQRYRCNACKKTFTPVTGTIFDARKLPVSAWVDYLMQAFSFESIAVMTREDRRSDTTIPYWVGKIFAVLDGIQDGVVLAGEVQIDETYYPVPTAEMVTKGGRRLRGLSRNQLCIGVGCDGAGRSCCIHEGFGKTSGSKTMAAFGDRVKEGSHLTHDMERAHGRLVRELGLSDVAYNAKEISKLPDADNPLREVNRLCYLLKRFLDSHSGFNRDNLQGWLDLFSVAMNPPGDKMEKVEFVLNRAMRIPVTLRFRDFYNVKPSSGAHAGS